MFTSQSGIPGCTSDHAIVGSLLSLQTKPSLHQQALTGIGRNHSPQRDTDVLDTAADDTPEARPPPNAETSFQTTWEGVDEEQPATSVQLRLLDGSRMVSPTNYCSSCPCLVHMPQPSCALRPPPLAR